MNGGGAVPCFFMAAAVFFALLHLRSLCSAEENLPFVSENSVYQEQQNEETGETSLAPGGENKELPGSTGMDFKAVNEMLLKQKQEQIIKAREKEQKKQERKERQQRQREERKKAREMRAAEMKAAENASQGDNGSAQNENGMNFAGNANELVITPEDFYAGAYINKEYIGQYFIFDLEPKAVSEVLPGIIDIPEFARNKKTDERLFSPGAEKLLIGKSGIEINGQKICSVCLQHRESWHKAHAGFIDRKIILMHLKPGCSLPAQEKGLIAVWIAPPELSFVHIEEYDCNKKVPVPKDMCTGWIHYYICD